MNETGFSATWAWYATSEASHHKGFEFAPTAGDLLAWPEVVESLVTTIRASGPGPVGD